jgi:hypothetical protein
MIQARITRIAVGLSVAMPVIFISQPATAATTQACTFTREQARSIAGSGNFVAYPAYPASDWVGTGRQGPLFEPQGADNYLAKDGTTITDYPAHIQLRFSPRLNCAWGLISLESTWRTHWRKTAQAPTVWLDTSYDGGRTIASGKIGLTNVASGFRSTYTPTESTAIGKWVRACGHGEHTVTGYTTKKARRLGIGISTENHRNPTVCTHWVRSTS